MATKTESHTLCSSSGHAKDLLISINQLRKLSKLCDVILVVDGVEFPAHRIVLAACSDYFSAMFTGDMVESQKQDVQIQGLCASTMENILEFIYTETVSVSVENVQALLPAACLLQLTGVQKACCEFLERQLDPANCLGIRRFAEMHGCEDLKNACDEYIDKNFVDLMKTEEFLQLESENIEKLLTRDTLSVSTEEVVFEALLSWIRQDEDSRSKYLPELLQHIRFPLLTPRYLTDVVDEERLIRRSLECRDLVDEGKKYHLRPDCRYQMQGSRTKPRVGLCEVLYVLGGFGNMQSPVNVVEKYDARNNEWSIVQPMSRRRRYLCAVSLNNKVFAIGGYDAQSRLNTVECFDPSTGQWTTIASMVQRRGLAGVTALGGKIYVAGGFDGVIRHTSVECYDPTIDQWSTVGEMTVCREGAGLANLDGMLYCVGGYDGNSILSSVERFDPRTGQWVQVDSMNTRRSGAGVAMSGGQIFAVGGYDGSQHLATVECYSPCADSWRQVSDMKSKRCYVGAASLTGKLLAVGGYDGMSLLNTIESFDLSTEEWSLIPSMNTSRCDMGVSVIVDQ